MRKTIYFIAAAISAVLLTACGSTTATSPTTPSMSHSAMAMVHKTGTFSGMNGKAVAGTVTIADDKLTLSGYSSDQGPDLHVYLTTGTTEAAVSAGKEISPVAYNQASQTFSLNGVDASMYTDVVIHCDKAKAVFGAAPVS